MTDTRQPSQVVQAQRGLFELEGRRVLVLGLGDSGLAMARWVAARGAVPVVADTRAGSATPPPQLARMREALGDDVALLGGAFDTAWLDGIDLVAWSPGLSIETGDAAALYRAAGERGIAVMGELELFAQALAELREGGYKPHVLGVTGTNGKTTVTALSAHLCNAAGWQATSAGNIGPPMLDALREAIAAENLPQVWVLELSSFQLALSDGFVADAALILNLSEDHLDWHSSMASYAAAKHRIHPTGTVAVWNRADAATRAGRDLETSFGADEPAALGDFGLLRDGPLVWLAQAVPDEAAPPPSRRRREPAAFTLRRLMPADALRIRGQHNQLNALASLALCSAIGVPMAKMLHALRDYRGEPHRCQLVGVIDDVEFYDDSKGTNVGATLAALEGLDRRVRLIVGGEGKGQDFSPLAPAVARHAVGVWLIGRDAPLLRQALAETGVPLVDCETLPQAVRAAREGARAGEAVLLSPACASFDMFRNYAHRAEVFVQAVQELAAESGQPLGATC